MPASSPSAPPIQTFLPYMHDVARYQRALHDLALSWRLIEATTRISVGKDATCILPTIEGARHHFDELERKLISSLVEEKLSGVLRELSAKALYIVDLVVRNLYERTADVAFLATDPEISRYMERAQTTDTEDQLIRERLRAYQRKYTVYDGIALFAPDGTLRAGVSTAGPLPEHCPDAFIQQALQQDGYVEIFTPDSSLQPWKRESLIYCHRIMGPKSDTAVGTLCLCFDLEDEMRGIFASHRDPSSRYNMLLLSEDDHCIAAADPAWVPPGAKVPANAQADGRLEMYAGRLYLIATRAATGYQGYPGPAGWRGQVMIPLDTAFSFFHQLPSTGSTRRLQQAEQMCPPLQDIVTAAETIRRVVWNGQVISGALNSQVAETSETALWDARIGTAVSGGDALRLQAVLDQISDTGARSDAMFQDAVRELYDTVLGFNMQDAEFIARLMVDLLDRNLYERANDCRWWALSPDLRDALHTNNAAAIERARQTLQHINSLYTVYTSIVLYDLEGAVVAASRRDASGSLPDTPVSHEVVQGVSRLGSEDAYVVEGFGPHAYYGDQSTYVYHAALRTDDGANYMLGGIALVFDSAVELSAMLDGALAGKPHSHACYVDRQGRIIAASSDSGMETGGSLPFAVPPEMWSVECGSSTCHLVEHGDALFIVACCASDGYREFKRSDGYRDDVLAITWQALGAVAPEAELATVPLNAESASSDGHPYAIFVCAGRLYAVSADKIQEARPADAMLPITLGGGAQCVGMLTMAADSSRALAYVYNLAAWLGEAESRKTGREVIVLNDGGIRIGLLVDQLHSVGRHIARPLQRVTDDNSIVREVLQFAGSLIPVLDAETLMLQRSRASL